VGRTVPSGPAYSGFNYFFSISKLRTTCKLQKQSFLGSRNVHTLHGDNLLQTGQLSFLAQLQNPFGFWIKNPGNKSNFELAWILNGFKPIGKNSLNSPKIFLDMIFNIVNLEWLTCIQKFEVPLHVGNRTKKKKNPKRVKFEFESPWIRDSL
jgi:hypothetical protein